MGRAFNGSTQYLSVADNATLRVALPIAVGLWVKGSSQGTFRYLVSKLLLASEHPSYGFSTNGAGDLRFAIGWGTSSGNVTVSPAIPSASVFDSTWHHILGTYDGTTVRMYLDAVEVSSGTSLSSAIAYAAQSLFLGSFDGTQLFASASLAELAIWSAIPDAAERSALARGMAADLIRPADLVARWPLYGQADPEPETFGGSSLTNSSSTADSSHPRLYLRSARALELATLSAPPSITGALAGTLPALTGSGAGSVTAASTAGGGGWYGLLDITREARQRAYAERTAAPVACPNDGEPYRTGPRGELFCPFDGYRPAGV